MDREESGVSILFSMTCISIIFILMSITFVTVRTRSELQKETEYYSSSITQEEIDEAWQKFQQREEIRKSLKLPKDSIDK
tara:strand:- start:26 stop:265 length:240 start_codon:yes stop_codon:yes gene_type:complete